MKIQLLQPLSWARISLRRFRRRFQSRPENGVELYAVDVMAPFIDAELPSPKIVDRTGTLPPTTA